MSGRYFEVLGNFLFWGLSSWLIISGFSIQTQELEIINGVESLRVSRDSSLMYQLATCIAISAVFFYVNLFIITHPNQLNESGKLLFRSALLFCLGLAIFTAIQSINADHHKLMIPVNVSIGIFCFYFSASSAYGIAKIWRRSEAQKQALIIQKRESELGLLRMQLHPHFLFNALNNLLSMVDQHKNPMLASSLDRLSGLLRYVVYDSSAAKVPLAREIEFIRNFSELNALRFDEDEVKFKLDIKGNNIDQWIEPGILIPFVENAFKYGTEPEKESYIDLTIDVSEKNKIDFKIQNPVFPLMQKQRGKGSGIDSVKRRLEIVYPQKHLLQIKETAIFEIHLIIETDESNHSG